MQSLMTWQPYVFSNPFFLTSFTSEQKEAHAPYILILLLSLSKAKGCGSGSEPHLRFSSVSCSPAPPPATSFQAYQTTIYADSLLHRPKKSLLPLTQPPLTPELCIRHDVSLHVSKSCNTSPAVATPVCKPRAGTSVCLAGPRAYLGWKSSPGSNPSGARLTSHRKKISGEIWFSLSKTLTCMRSVSLLLTSVR